MAKQLRSGLIDPHDVPPEDLNQYMATTYGGYYRSLQQRLYFAQSLVDNPPPYGTTELIIESVALQLRMCAELIANSVSAFNQVQLGKPHPKKRQKEYRIKDVLRDIPDNLWPLPIDPDAQEIVPDRANDLEHVLVSILASKNDLNSLHGDLGNLLHEKQRPRNQRLPVYDQVLRMIRPFRIFADRHMIYAENGQGWYIDSRAEFGSPADRETLVQILGIKGAQKQ
ncbi:MAG: hypothetical protein AAF292_11050 [Pseudomonadota bacterium]